MASPQRPNQDRVREVREKAKTCVLQADDTSDEDARIILLDLAMHWMRLAEASQAHSTKYDLPEVAQPDRRE